MSRAVSTGWIFYRGPSTLQPGRRIIGVITTTTKNPKTGPMHQVWILPSGERSLTDPVWANRTGRDRSVCGDCPLRAGDGERGRGCYVTLIHGPRSVGAAVTRGRYPDLSGDPSSWPALSAPLRLGAYGDPAAIPLDAWRPLLARARRHGWTGYTHQWATTDPRWARYVMASVESVDGADRARAAGWRTFRVEAIPDGPLLAAPLRAREVACPASAERGYKQTCAACRLCSGTTGRGAESGARDVRIYAHGAGAKMIGERVWRGD